MGDRINDTSGTSDVSSARKSAVEADTPPGGDESEQIEEGPYGFYTDEVVRGTDSQAEFERMTTGGRPEAQRGVSKDRRDGEATTVGQMQAAQSRSGGGVDLEDHPFAGKLADDVFGNEAVGLFGTGGVDRAFDSQVSANLGIPNSTFAENAELVDDRDRLVAFIGDRLAERSDAPDDPSAIREVASELADEIEERAVRGLAGRIEKKARAQIEGSREMLSTVNGDSRARRAFLAEIAVAEGDPQVIEERLGAFGVDASRAEKLADLLADLHGDPEAIAGLEVGEAGPQTGRIFKRGQFDRAEELLEEALDAMDGKLENLASDALGRRAENKHERLLVDPNFAAARAEAFEEYGVDVDASEGGGDGLDRAIVEAIQRAEHEEQVEGWQRTGVSFVIGIGGGIATGGVAAGVVAAAIETGADFGASHQKLELARAAEQAELGEAGVVETASGARNAEVAKGLARIVFAGANVSGKAADAMPEHAASGSAEAVKSAFGGGVKAGVDEAAARGIDDASQ